MILIGKLSRAEGAVGYLRPTRPKATTTISTR